MARGGRDKSQEREGGLDRRCLATGDSAPREGLIRFALSPEGVVTPDLAEKLPGRGAWVSASRSALQRVAEKGLFARGFKRSVTVPQTLDDTIEQLLAKRVIESLALARKAGDAVCGFERTREALWSGDVALLLGATEGSEPQRRKLANLAEGARISYAVAGAELGLAFGRETVIHAALLGGGTAARCVREVKRLEGVRGIGHSERTGAEATAMS